MTRQTYKNPDIKRILIITSKFVSHNEAVSGNRGWQLAERLSPCFDVILAVPGLTSISHHQFAVLFYNRRSIGPLAADNDAVICDAAALSSHTSLARASVPIAVDLALWEPRRHGRPLEAHFQKALSCGDFFLCDSEEARQGWLRALTRVGRVNVYTGSDEKGLRCLIDTIGNNDNGASGCQQSQALDEFCRFPRFARDRGTPFNEASLPSSSSPNKGLRYYIWQMLHGSRKGLPRAGKAY